MKYHKQFGIFFLYLIAWCHLTSAMSPYKTISEPINSDPFGTVIEDLRPLIRDNRSLDISDGDTSIILSNKIETELELRSQEHDVDYHLPNGHHIQKRSLKVVLPALTLAKCGIILYLCALIPLFNIFCILNCLLSAFVTMKYLIFILPSTVATMCLIAGTVFPVMPKTIAENKKRFTNVKNFFKFYNIKEEDQGDFAKSAANALMVVLIKNSIGSDFDELKPLLEALELEDPETSGRRLAAVREAEQELGGRILPAVPISDLLPSFNWDLIGSGKYFNDKCRADGTYLPNPSAIIAEAIRKRPCITDILLPGYFVFNRVPTVAATQMILPIVRAFNMPLFLFTGTKCCMQPYAKTNKRYQCFHKYSILDRHHGLPPQNGPNYVCGAIPDFSALKPPPPTTIPQPGPGPTNPTTVPPCDDEYSEDCNTSPPQATTTEDYDSSYPDESTTTEGAEGRAALSDEYKIYE